ncbi:MAG: hypothetical protein AAGE88_18325 [Actinomycetota bacterium]
MSRRPKQRPRPLTRHQLGELADDLEALASELRAAHAEQVQANLGVEADAGYPATTSGAGGNNGSAASSRPEALTIRPDPAATRANTLLALLTVIHRAAPTALRGLRARNPGREVRSCPRCNHVIPDGHARCQRMITDQDDDTSYRCGICRETGNGCPREGEPFGVGDRARHGRCETCAKRHERAQKTTPRHGDPGGRAPSERIARVDRLQLDTAAVIVQEVDQ